MDSTNTGGSSRRSNRPGFGFQPKEEQLISFFLTNKVLGRDYEVQDIPTLDDICKYEPWDLPEISTMEAGVGVQEWYFFCPPKYKYQNSEQINRKTKEGYWKVTCRSRNFKSGNGTVGEKTTLVFFQGSSRKGKRTSWIMYQYKLTSDIPNQKKWVFLYKLMKRDNGKANASINTSQPSYDLPNANAIIDLGDSEMPETGQGALLQMKSDESQPSHDNGNGLGDLGDLDELADGQIADVVSHLQPEMKSCFDETYYSLLSVLQPQMQGEQQQAFSLIFPTSSDSSGNTSQNHYYSGDFNQDSELQPQLQGEQQASSSLCFPLSNDSENHCYSGNIIGVDDVLWYSLLG
ncbi:hypothetical protein SLE2022_193260 [Rubroshorea leprosula]